MKAVFITKKLCVTIAIRSLHTKEKEEWIDQNNL